MTPTDNIHMLAGPYALNALDDLERIRFEAHLDTCDACTTEVAEFLSTTALLGQVDEVPLSDAFRESVLAEIDTIRQIGPLRTPVRRIAPRIASVAAGVLAVAVLSLSFVTASLRAEVDRLEHQAEFASILEEPDAVTLDLVIGDSAMHVVASPAAGTGGLIASGMEAAPNGHAYQLWLITDADEALPAGFLEIDEAGSGLALMEGDMDGVVAIGITVEPAGGSESPTTEPIAVVPLSA